MLGAPYPRLTGSIMLPQLHLVLTRTKTAQATYRLTGHTFPTGRNRSPNSTLPLFIPINRT